MDMPGWMTVTIYAVLMLGFLGIYSWRHDADGIERKPFTNLIILVAFMLINDFVSRFYIFDGFPHWAVVLCTYINFAVLPAIGVQWYRYVRTIITAEERHDARRLDLLIYVIAGIGMAVLIITPFTGLVFSFDATGVYHRGPVFFFPAGSTFLCIIIAEAFLLLRVRSLSRLAFLTLMAFPVPPLVGGIVAMFIYGVPWMPLGISFSMLILFANVQSVGLGKDYLTGVYNRRRLEEFLDDRINSARLGRLFGGLMVDIDDFKSINDTLGHSTGDLALSDTARLLRSSLRTGDIVGRYGGDEFLVLIDADSEEELRAVVDRIGESEQAFNMRNTGYHLRLSKGYALFNPKAYDSARDFEEELDRRMYADKQRHRGQVAETAGSDRRNTDLGLGA